MQSFDLLKFFLVIVATGLGLLLAFHISKTRHQKLIIFSLIIGFFVYNGVAVSYKIAPIFLLASYAFFLIAIVCGFIIGKSLFLTFGRTLDRNIGNVLETLIQGRAPMVIIALYFAIHLFYLIYQEFRLHLIFSPPSPDIRQWFEGRYATNVSFIIAFLKYIEILLVPFFYFSLYKYKQKLLLLLFFIFTPLYISYILNSYLGRYQVLFSLIFIFMVIWTERPRWRSSLVLLSVLILPALAYIASVYSRLRIGGDFSDVEFFSSISRIFQTETSFLINTGLPLLESGKTIDLIGYYSWILTLPIPGFLKGWLEVPLINYEISEIVLERKPGSSGFYVVLPGLLSESYYIYGRWFFWVHGLFFGCFAAFFCKILERNESLKFVFYYVCIVLLFNLNRGGVGSVLPPLINGFLGFFVFIFLMVIMAQRKKKSHFRFQ